MEYVSIDFWRFALGLVVVGAPAIVLDELGERRFAYSYAALILLMLALQNESGIVRFSGFLRRELSRRP